MPRYKLKANMMGYRFMGRKKTAPPHSWRNTILSKGCPDVPDGTLMDATPLPGHTYTRYTWPPRGRGRGESLYSPRRVAAKLKALEVVRLRIMGNCTWATIAATLGYKDASGAYRAYWRMMDRINWDRDERDRLKRWA